MKYLIMILFACLFVSCSKKITQVDYNKKIECLKESNPSPQLSKEQMYYDFDILVHTIHKYNPQIIFRNEITGTNMIDEIVGLRKNIDSIETTTDFIVLLKNVLGYVHDSHCKQAGNLFFYRNSVYRKEVKKLNIDNSIFGINFNYSGVLAKKKLPFKLVYNNGRYFNIKNINVVYESHDSIIQKGSEIISINNKKIGNLIESNKDKQDFIGWDFKKNEYFIRQNLCVPLDFNLMTIEYKYKGKVKTLNVDSIRGTRSIFNTFKDLALTHYFKIDSVLYIRLPDMSSFWLKKIKKQILGYKNEIISSVVIDVRGNKGGDDIAWIKLIKYIINEPVVYKTKLAVNEGTCLKNKNKLKYISKDNNEFYYDVVYNYKNKIRPNLNNLKYKGKIYIMMDENIFSSTGAFIASISQDSRFVTIGKRTGMFLGQGLTPDVFILPNSKFCYYIEKYIDITNGIEIENIFNDKPNISLDLPVDYYINREKDKIDIYSKEYLLNNDVFFKKVLNYIRN